MLSVKLEQSRCITKKVLLRWLGWPVVEAIQSNLQMLVSQQVSDQNEISSDQMKALDK